MDEKSLQDRADIALQMQNFCSEALKGILSHSLRIYKVQSGPNRRKNR